MLGFPAPFTKCFGKKRPPYCTRHFFWWATPIWPTHKWVYIYHSTFSCLTLIKLFLEMFEISFLFPLEMSNFSETSGYPWRSDTIRPCLPFFFSFTWMVLRLPYILLYFQEFKQQSNSIVLGNYLYSSHIYSNHSYRGEDHGLPPK